MVSGISTLDELPEAIELPGRRFVLGVQWHPEADEESPVVGAFVARPRSAPTDARARVARAVHILPALCGASRAIRATRLDGGARGGRGAARAQAGERAGARDTRRVAFAAPVALCVAVRRSRAARHRRPAALQMWAYIAAYKTPHDDAAAQEQRVHVRYPIVADRVLGLGELPSVRLQRALARSGPDGPHWRALDRVLVWAHWSWFAVPHASLLYILARHPRHFERAAVMTYAVFDVGASFYWVIPTAPPWYAASSERGSERGRGRGAANDGGVRRVLLARRLGLPLQCLRRKSPRRDAVPAFRHVRDGRDAARGGEPGRRALFGWSYAATLGVRARLPR